MDACTTNNRQSTGRQTTQHAVNVEALRRRTHANRNKMKVNGHQWVFVVTLL